MIRPVLVAAAMLLAAGPAPAADTEAGRAFLEANCGGCHATGRDGSGALAAAPPFRTLGQRYPVDELEEALAEGIITGHPDMPEIAIDPAMIDNVIAWLTAIQIPQ